MPDNAPSDASWLAKLLDHYALLAKHLHRTLTVVAVGLFVVGVCATCFAVLARQFPAYMPSASWAIELTNLSIIAAVLLIVPRGLRENTHMAVTYLPTKLGHRGLQILTAVNSLLIGAFFLVVVWYGMDAMGLNRSQRTPVLGISQFWPYLLVVVSAALMLLETVVRLLEALVGRAPRPTYEDAANADVDTEEAAR